MFIKLLLILTIVPMIELALLLNIHGNLSSYYGSSNALLLTISVIVGTGVIGAKLARSQGLSVLAAIRDCLAQGKVPTSELAEGVLVLIGGILLLTPGYLTDVIGLSFLFPVTRGGLSRKLIAILKNNINNQNVSYTINYRYQADDSHSEKLSKDSNVIDVKPTDEK